MSTKAGSICGVKLKRLDKQFVIRHRRQRKVLIDSLNHIMLLDLLNTGAG